jgi:UPF0716 family protein affecting phage T7 exclusion
MIVVAASVGGAILIVLVLIIVFLGTAFALSRRGSGIGEHPRQDREADQRPED